MSTYLQDLERSDPELARAWRIVGNQPRPCLANMVRALGMHAWQNDDDDKLRLAAAKLILSRVRLS